MLEELNRAERYIQQPALQLLTARRLHEYELSSKASFYATTSRIDWRTLLKRTFDVDLRVCVRCRGKLTVRAVFTDPASVAKLLGALRSPRAPPTAA